LPQAYFIKLTYLRG